MVLAWVYFGWFYQPAGCFDNKQNQGETGVDCGGPCALSCERLTIKPVEALWSRAVPLKENAYDLVAQVNNPNPNFGLGQVKYNFKVYDSGNQLLAQKSGVDYILPGQKKYLIEANVALAKTPAKVEIIIDAAAKADWQELKDNFESPDIYVHDKQFKYLEGQTGVAQASGIIKNNSQFDFDKISVAVVLFDENKDIVGVNKTVALTIPAGEERYFAVLWYDALPGQVKSADMLADTNLFSDANFMRRYGTQQKFQEYQTSATPAY